MCESLIYGYKAGLNLEEVIAAVGAGAAGSWSINNLGPRMLVRNFNPGFRIDLHVKDLGNVVETAQEVEAPLVPLEAGVPSVPSVASAAPPHHCNCSCNYRSCHHQSHHHCRKNRSTNSCHFLHPSQWL